MNMLHELIRDRFANSQLIFFFLNDGINKVLDNTWTEFKMRDLVN
jgi:hypothetical protein